MGVSAGIYMYDVVVKSSRSLSHLLVSSCYKVTDKNKLAPFMAHGVYTFIHHEGRTK